MSIITLTTDFGAKDEYVGLMKGVILSLNPSVTIVDITHQIDSQDIVQAAFSIYSAFRYFPAQTVHLIVVDPGVGTARNLLALETGEQFFVAPDNGVLTLLFTEEEITSLVCITNPDFFLNKVSATFHGRDIIAPVGAHITKGVELDKLGTEIGLGDVIHLDGINARVAENGDLSGNIVAIDHFGNLISNISSRKLTEFSQTNPKKKIRFQIGSHVIKGLSETYASVPPKAPVALIGSRGYLEIAVNQGNAGLFFNAQKGDPVRVSV
jgi:S-adenosylmethionine hydrolase